MLTADLDQFYTIYLDDFLIHSNTLEEYRVHIARIFNQLSQPEMTINQQKCKFHIQQAEFLGYIVSTKGVCIDPTKVNAIRNCQDPRNVHDIQVFLKCANFHLRFIAGCSKKAVALSDLSKRRDDFIGEQWLRRPSKYCKRNSVVSILNHNHPNLETVLQTHACNYVVVAILLQYHVINGKSRRDAVAFYARQITSAKCNYKIHDKELLTDVVAFEI